MIGQSGRWKSDFTKCSALDRRTSKSPTPSKSQDFFADWVQTWSAAPDSASSSMLGCAAETGLAGAPSIRRMNTENPLWGAPRIHGELLKLGFEVAETTVSKAEDRHPRAGGHSCATMRRRLLRLISAWFSMCRFPFSVRRNQRFAITDLAREEGVHVPHPRHLTAYYASRR